MKPLAECLLYTFIDTAYLKGRSPELVAQQLVDGGSDLVQLRAKDASPDQVRRMAEGVRPILERGNVELVINDYPQVARDVGARYCHLGQEDFFDAGYVHVNDVEQSLPRIADSSPGPTPMGRLQIGLSSHAPVQAERAIQAGADYIAIGPVYATGTKPTARPVTLEYVRWAGGNVGVPWFAIGGINLENLDQVLEAGARRICVVSAILLAPDSMEACQRFKDRLLSAPRTI